MTFAPHLTHFENQKVRPSASDLQSDDLFEQLELEASKLRTGNDIHYSGLRSGFSATDSNAQTSKPNTKKSRFAQQREAQLLQSKAINTSQCSEANVSVPIGRFVLDLENNPHKDNFCTQAAPQEGDKKAILSAVIERVQAPSHCSNEEFTSSFHPSGFPSVRTESSDHPSKAPSLFPWEIRRLARRTSSQITESKTTSSPHLPGINIHNHSTAPALDPATPPIFSPEVRTQISIENDLLLASMSQSELLQEQAALKKQLRQSNPALLAKLLVKHQARPGTCILASRLEHSNTNKSPVDDLKNSKSFNDQSISSQPSVNSVDSQPHNLLNSVPDSNRAQPVRFNFRGKAVFHCCTDNSESIHPFQDIHIHQTNSFSLTQLLQLLLSSVSPQRVIGFTIMSQIIHRYFCTAQVVPGLAQEINILIPDILTIASQAVSDKNIGVASNALILLHSVLAKAQVAQSMPDCSSSFQSIWIEELLTQTSILEDFHCHFRHQTLPQPSLILIIQILCALIDLGESTKVSEEILTAPAFLETIIQVLMAVSWPPIDDKTIEIPDLTPMKLLQALANTSRTCSQSILNRGLLTPTLRFIGLPYWNLTRKEGDTTTMLIGQEAIETLIRLMSYQFQLIQVFAGYGLGTSLRTTLDTILRSTTSGLLKIFKATISGKLLIADTQITLEFELISAFLKLLKAWALCAVDPHVTDPPHSINWIHIMEWQVEIVEFLKLSVASNEALRLLGVDNILGCLFELIGVQLTGSIRKQVKIKCWNECLKTLEPQLQVFSENAVQKLISASHESGSLGAKPFNDISWLIGFAKLLNCVRHIAPPPEELTTFSTDSFSFSIPDATFAYGCCLAFKHEELACLPWALSVFHHDLDSQKIKLERLLISSLLVRNSAGRLTFDLIATILEECQSKVDCELDQLIGNQEKIIFFKLSNLLPIYQDYINQSGTLTSISDPSPQQIQNQASQSEKPAFLLSSTWPLIAITFLNESHLKSSKDSHQTQLVAIFRASYALAVILQSLLLEIPHRLPGALHIFRRLVSDRYMVWKTILETVVTSHSQAFTCFGPNNEALIFEDELACRLITRLLSLCSLGTSHNQCPSLQTRPQTVESGKSVKMEQLEDSELYTLFTNILGAYDSTSFGNQTFSKLLVPFFSMKRSRNFRKLLFIDYVHILRYFTLTSKDALVVDGCSTGLEPYLTPLESSEPLLYTYTALLSANSPIQLSTHPFLSFYLLHHVSSQIWNSKIEERLRIGLIENILDRSNDQVCEFVLSHPQLCNVLQHELEPTLSTPKCGEHKGEPQIFKQRYQWLEMLITNPKYLERIKKYELKVI